MALLRKDFVGHLNRKHVDKALTDSRIPHFFSREKLAYYSCINNPTLQIRVHLSHFFLGWQGVRFMDLTKALFFLPFHVESAKVSQSSTPGPTIGLGAFSLCKA